jgi:hypothetical protein
MSALRSAADECSAPSVRAPKYYVLFCSECNKRFPSVLATSEEEILDPDFDDLWDRVGSLNAERFELFYWEHRYHSLEAAPL